MLLKIVVPRYVFGSWAWKALIDLALQCFSGGTECLAWHSGWEAWWCVVVPRHHDEPHLLAWRSFVSWMSSSVSLTRCAGCHSYEVDLASLVRLRWAFLVASIVRTDCLLMEEDFFTWLGLLRNLLITASYREGLDLL